MSRRKNFGKRLGFEALERRAMLAGNVTATLADHTLTITGDIADNDIVLSGGHEKVFTIASGIDATTINGGAGPVTFSHVKRLVISMGAGGDRLVINANGEKLKHGSVDMGIGDDTLTMDARRMEKMSVDMGIGHNTFTLTGDKVKKFSLAAGDGDDTLTMNASRMKKVSVDMGIGHNTFTLTGDKVKKFSLAAGDGDDTLTMNASRMKKVSVNMGAGANTLNMTSARAKKVSVTSGDGVDTVNLNGSRWEKIRVNTAGGNDVVAVNVTNKLKKINVNLGAGDDTLTFQSLVPRSRTLDGGTGANTLRTPGKTIAANGTYHDLVIANFQTFVAT